MNKMSENTTSQKVDLILRDLQEYFKEDVEKLTKIIDKRPLKIYWGTAPTGRIHIGYLVPLLKIKDFLDAGCEVTILLADLHAFLDNNKSELSQIEARSNYYELMIKSILTELGADIKNINFIKGTSFQLKPDYNLDVYRMNSMLTVNNAKHAGADVVKLSDNPIMNGLIYPSLQALDEVYLDVDAQFGGVDQRKIFMHARTYLPKLKSNPLNADLKYHKRIHFMNKMIPGFSTTKKEGLDVDTKMSASNNSTKIDILDSSKKIKKTINSAYCAPGDIEDNSVLNILSELVFKILISRKSKFIIRRKEEHGGDIEYSDYKQVEQDFLDNKLHPQDLKNGLGDFLIELFDPIKKIFDAKDNLKLLKDCQYLDK